MVASLVQLKGNDELEAFVQGNDLKKHVTQADRRALPNRLSPTQSIKGMRNEPVQLEADHVRRVNTFVGGLPCGRNFEG